MCNLGKNVRMLRVEPLEVPAAVPQQEPIIEQEPVEQPVFVQEPVTRAIPA